MRDFLSFSIEERRKYWNSRVNTFGHTGWSNPILYKYDQFLRMQHVLRLIDEYSKFSLDSRALDFGCGVGEFSEQLAKRYSPLKIIGLDISDQTIALARQRLDSLQNVELFSGELKSLPVDYDYDLILCVTVLQHIACDELPDFFAMFSRQLKSGGYILILENIYNSVESKSYINTSFKRASWVSLGKDAGLIVDKVTSYPHWGVIAVEIVFQFLEKIRSTFKNKSKNDALNTIPSVGVAKMSLISKVLIRFILILMTVLDRIFKLLPPQGVQRYGIFIMRKP